MGQIETVFFENPAKDFHIRGIARMLKIPKTTVSYQVKRLLKEGLIAKNKKGVFTSFRANESSEIYRFCKTQEFLKELVCSGVLGHIEKEVHPRCIILFGSFAKGEYDSKSDIDLFVQSEEASINLGKFEKRLRHAINILFEADAHKLSAELFNNIANGVKLRGFLKVK